MATCDPKTLPAQATCFRCLDRGELHAVNLFLLWTAAGDQISASQLAQNAVGFRGLDHHSYLAAKAYLLAVITSSPTTPATLASLAACWNCIPKSERANVETYLYAQSAGPITSTSAMEAGAKQFRGVDRYEEAELWLLAFMAGSLTPAQIMSGSACLRCFNNEELRIISLYLLCIGLAGANIIPPGSTYGPGSTFTIAINTNTYYRITWGANDVSANVCGTVYNSGGAGTTTVFYSGSCNTLVLTGNIAGTLVTALVQPVNGVQTAPSNFAFVPISTTQGTATWDTPPNGVSSTELWTSSDGVTFALAATVAAPGTSATVNVATAVGNITYAEARWNYTVQGEGPFTKAQKVYGAVTNWAARVVTNGGAAVSTATLKAMNTFYDSLSAAGTIIAKVKGMICVTPGSLIEATTPLIKNFGSDPWAPNGVPGTYELLTSGVRATAANNIINSGILPSTCFASTSTGGLSVYITATTAADANAVDIGCNVSAAQTCQLYTEFNTNFSIQQIYNNTNAQGSLTGTSQGTGFYCANVPSAGQEALYYYSSVAGFLTLATAAASGGTRPTVQIYGMGVNNNGVTGGTTTVRRYSFFAIHDGLTSAEAKALATAVQNLRVALGGGFV